MLTATIHLVATLAMAGVIWTVQLVQYPLFAAVGPSQFPAFHAAHMRRITWLVGPLMLSELGTAAWLALFAPAATQATALVGLGLIAVAWGSTVLLQVPQHTRLQRGFDADIIRRLVRGNWIRTAAWTLRVPAALALLAAAAAP